MNHELFFSIVVPAHNEEKYIEATLTSLRALDYPKELYEVIVVENGSSDKSLEKAKAFSSDSMRILSMKESGVSRARNRGIEETSPNTDWILFLDADTLLAPPLLGELESFLARASARDYSVGTTSIRPEKGSTLAKCWFMFYDLVHRYTKSSCSFFMVRRECLGAIRFDENLTIMEDLHFTTALRKKGKFFFVPTRSVSTSTRRFDADGWFSLLLLYAFVGMLPVRMQKRFRYMIVR